jgi:hypothetical protein
MNSVGIDLDRKRYHVAVLDEHGTELLSRRIVNDPQTFLELLAGIDGESKIALSASALTKRPAQSRIRSSRAIRFRLRAWVARMSPTSFGSSSSRPSRRRSAPTSAIRPTACS